MATWGAFAAAEQEMAAAMRGLFYQYGPGLGLLATTRADGGPRLHPVCPVITDDGLYCFVVDSPKRRDLERDGRYALHANPPEDIDDEALLMGRAERTDDPQTRDVVIHAYHRPDVPDEEWLYSLSVERALLSRCHRGDWPPTYSVWRDPST